MMGSTLASEAYPVHTSRLDSFMVLSQITMLHCLKALPGGQFPQLRLAPEASLDD